MARLTCILGSIALLFLTGVVGAQESGPLIVSPNGELPLRSEPPGLFSSRGAKIGSVEPNEQYLVLQRKSVPSVFGTQEWLKVQPISPDGGEVGWTFSGTGGGMQNFSVHSSEELQLVRPVQ